jgi:hypothetical protein
MPRRALVLCPRCTTRHLGGTRCPVCAARRGTTSQRGYGTVHQRLRARLQPLVDAGLAQCWRCEQLIDPGDDWDLGHDDDRRVYRGPEHLACNRDVKSRH